MSLAQFLAVWALVSLPLAVFFGKFIASGR